MIAQALRQISRRRLRAMPARDVINITNRE
jgi:hypothetical protein